MKLSIISLNYTHADLTIRCMQTLFDQFKNEFEKNEFEYIVVDNKSPDDSVLQIKKAIKDYKNFRLVENTENSGFGAGNNLGVKNAKGEHIVFLNNDTQIKGDGIKDMLEYMEEHPQIGILGGELRNFDNTPQSSTGRFYSPFSVLLLLLGMQRMGFVDKNPVEVSQVDWVKGALMMMKKETFEKIHGFDEKIFMYTEDMEICYRAKKAGYKIYFYPTQGVLHKDQGSSNRTFAIVNIYKNLLYFYKKHRPFWEYLWVKTLLKVKAIILVIFGKISNKKILVSTYEQALAAIR